MTMPRPIAILAAVALAACLVHAADSRAEATPQVTLNSAIVVDDAVVRLGDLFSGLSAQADTALARAPEPGRQVRLGANWLHRVARAYGVDWRPASPAVEATLRRASQRIEAAAIKQALAGALARRGVDGDVEIELDTTHVALTLPTSARATVAVARLSHDAGTGRFSAGLVAPASGAPAARATVTGRVVRMIEVPVTARRVARGEVIDAGDLTVRRLPARRLARGHLTEAEAIVGKSARRAVRAGRPLRAGDVREPVLVARNALVTITLETPRMRLTAQGRALEEGALGEVVRVVNTKSKTTVAAVVTASNTVAVRP